MTNNLAQEPLTITVAQLAKTLQIARGKAYELVATGEIPSIRVGRSVRIPRAELMKWMDNQAHKQGSK